jgi:hypothetical protein
VRHKALERRKAADAEHHEIALLARTDAQFGQRLRAPRLFGERLPFDLQGAQSATAVRRHEHGAVTLPPGSA